MGCCLRGPSMKTIVVGLAGAGKSSLLATSKLGVIEEIQLAPGFKAEVVKFQSMQFISWDSDAVKSHMASVRPYYLGAAAVLFIVDSADHGRIPAARAELDKLLKLPELQPAVLVVYANKQDLPSALSPVELTSRLGLSTLQSHPWYMQASNAVSGDGVFEGLDWVSGVLAKR